MFSGINMGIAREDGALQKRSTTTDFWCVWDGIRLEYCSGFVEEI